MKILLVDDDVELTKAVEAALTSYDHDIQTTNDPREGLELIKEKNYDLIFLDRFDRRAAGSCRTDAARQGA